MKNVAFTPFDLRISNILGVIDDDGPSSNVRYIIPLFLPVLLSELLLWFVVELLLVFVAELLLVFEFTLTISFFTTVTVLVFLAWFPLLSLTVYIIAYSPVLVVSTFPVITILSLKSPSISSVAFAPCSLYFEFNSMLNFALPFNVISGGSLSTNFIVLATVALFLELSSTV